MRPKKYSERFIMQIKEQKKILTAKQVAEKNNMSVSQVNYVLYMATPKNEELEIPRFLVEDSLPEFHADEKKFKDLYTPRSEVEIEKPKKRSFLDWLLGR
jgi:hypothetical protein|tara:strand:+ start:2895 stop:3194 length:300 start_codon:yes stop_codon:yes gene_type:complete